MKMKPRADFGGMNALGLPAGEGPFDIPEQHIEAARWHGFTEWVESPATHVKVERVEVPVEVEKIVEKEVPVEVESDADTLPENADEFDVMSRAYLFGYIGKNGGGALPRHKTPELRAMAREIKAKLTPPAAPAPPPAP